MTTLFHRLRADYHRRLRSTIWGIDSSGIPSNADKSSRLSVSVAATMLQGDLYTTDPMRGQRAGAQFAEITREFVQGAFSLLEHLRPGDWYYSTVHGREGITAFEQYRHLATLHQFLSDTGLNSDLKASFVYDYLVLPDIVVGRVPIADDDINVSTSIISSGEREASLTPLRIINNEYIVLHASISCKWTIRSDRAQNTRTEALNLIRNRKGNTPHIVVVTGEPLPTRLASLALGTGDLDCVYHMALYELEEALRQVDDESQIEMLELLVNGRRLRDISDLPFDLAV